MQSEPTAFGITNFRYKKTSTWLVKMLVAGAGFEPTTFGL
jgi:hypothetical protein